ncbi:MAG: hypothetical protein H6954_08305 [Chromatiaceae bacterium]|nr:hypothetical protein [Chromatiaceae bacterium]
MSEKPHAPHRLALALAFPVLALGWFSFAAGTYHLAATASQATASREDWLLPMWELAFSFGATGIATWLAAKAGFGAKPVVRKLFVYSLVVVSALFLGYLAVEILSALVLLGRGLLSG